MSAIDDGGPAYPIKGYCVDASGALCGEVITHKGMTLRDWFAGMALQGRAHRLGNPHDAREILAQDCYDIADAMLAARKGGAND